MSFTKSVLWFGAIFTCVGIVEVSTVSAQTLAATEERHGFGFGYGDTRWTNFSDELDARFDQVDIITDLTDIDEMLEYDAIMIQIRDFGGVLSPVEQDNIAAYIETGRRVLFVGENSLWTGWNNSFLSLVGGSFLFEGDGIFTVLNPYPPITDGVTSLDVPNCGLTSGGLSLFTANWTTIFPGDGSENVLTMLDVNVVENDRWNTLDAAAFAAGVAEWLASGAGGGPVLEVAGSCPGRLTATVSGATANGTVAFIYARGEGAVSIPSGPCAGTQLGLNATAQLVGTASADANGDASFSGNAPAAACGGFVQALDVSSCGTTNVAGI